MNAKQIVDIGINMLAVWNPAIFLMILLHVTHMKSTVNKPVV